MSTLTSFQRLELILIPLFFLFSQVLVFLLGLTMIGEKMWIYMGIPILCGSALSVLISYFLFQKKPIYEFKQLESYFRILILGGGGVLIPVLISQILGLLSGFLIFTLLSLVFSTLGGLMIISCINLLYRSRPNLVISE